MFIQSMGPMGPGFPSYCGQTNSLPFTPQDNYAGAFSGPPQWLMPKPATMNFQQFSAMSEEERADFLKNLESRTQAAEEQHARLMAEREQEFQQQQAQFRARWQAYNQQLQQQMTEDLKPENNQGQGNASLAGIL